MGSRLWLRHVQVAWLGYITLKSEDCLRWERRAYVYYIPTSFAIRGKQWKLVHTHIDIFASLQPNILPMPGIRRLIESPLIHIAKLQRSHPPIHASNLSSHLHDSL